jgi:colicin import membrane protein
MSWREHVEPDWFHEAPFYLAAIIAHGALLSINPVINWGGLKPAEKAVPIEFVAEIPLPPIVSPPMPSLAPGGDGSNAPPTLSPKPAAVKSQVNKPGPTVQKAKIIPRAKPVVRPDAQAAKFAREAQAESKRLRAERDRAVRAVAAEKAAAARAKARAERDRFEAAARAERERRAALARAEAERRAEAARQAAERRAAALAEQRRLAAEAKAAKAAKRAELSAALATMSDPDETLDAGTAPAPSERGSARKGRPAVGGPVAGKGGAFGEADAGDGGGRGGGEAELAGARKAGAAAALAESTDPSDAAGSGGADLLDSKAKGGGIGPNGGGVSWSVDGPVGNRRILTRVAPQSPDWVATRNLDLTVTVRFQVLPDGSVKSGAVIQKTSGFPDIDSRALKALSRWRFQPVPAKSGTAEVWGRVTFRFTS